MPPAEILKAHLLRFHFGPASGRGPACLQLRSSVPPAEILKAHFNSGDFTQFLIGVNGGVKVGRVGGRLLSIGD